MATLRIVARAGQRAELHDVLAAGSVPGQDGAPEAAPAAASVEPVSSFVLSSDGAKMFTASAAGVHVYTTQGPSADKVGSLPEPGVVLLALSPGGQYLVTCQKPSKPAPGEAPNKNLKVWDAATLEPVFAYTLKTVSKDAWPAVSWAADDSAFAVAVPNAAHIFHRADRFTVFTKVTIKALASLALCPTSAHGALVAGFIPESKGSPASAALYPCDAAGEPSPRIRKAFFRTQGARLMWNAGGTALLVLSYADYDVTNQSYYGEQKLHYLPADPAKVDGATTVALPKEGPVHDVQWAPAGDFFLTVAGFMPAKATLWDAQCRPIYDFGSGPYSIVRWNPFGRFIALAGFGNLPGDILFFDKLASGTCKQMGATRCPAVSAEWSPDGRHLLVATTAPRLRVDNKAQVLSYTGQLLETRRFEVLFEAAWLPAPPGTFSHRAPSPDRLKEGTSGLAAGAGGGPAPAAQPAAKAAGYVPPHLRGVNGAVLAPASAPSFSLGFDASDRGGRIQSARAGGATGSSSVAASAAAAAAARRVVPGAEFVNVKASPPAGQKKGKKGGAGGGTGSAAASGAAAATATPAEAAKPLEQALAEQASVSGAAVGPVKDGAAGGDTEPQKRLRNLQKKLRQVEQLKAKLAAEGEAALEPEQLKKIKTEAALLEEIQALGGTP